MPSRRAVQQYGVFLFVGGGTCLVSSLSDCLEQLDEHLKQFEARAVGVDQVFTALDALSADMQKFATRYAAPTTLGHGAAAAAPMSQTQSSSSARASSLADRP
eukprot:m.33860 g.33860  ORF g.33860 m.33860 type:complete len:103 (+) comp9494_c0_seq1:178-486(+)